MKKLAELFRWFISSYVSGHEITVSQSPLFAVGNLFCSLWEIPFFFRSSFVVAGGDQKQPCWVENLREHDSCGQKQEDSEKFSLGIVYVVLQR